MPRLAAVLAVLAVAGACSEADEPAPVRETTPAQQPTPDAGDVPLDGLPEAPVRWREAEPNDEPGVLAARRLLALRYVSAAAEEPNSLTPLYPTVAGGTALEVFGEPFPNPTPPPEALDRGPVYGWVMATAETGDDQVVVDICYDTGWSDRGAPPAQRLRQAFPLRLVVTRDAAPGDAWKVTTYRDPARELVGADATRECQAWGETHPTADSPA